MPPTHPIRDPWGRSSRRPHPLIRPRFWAGFAIVAVVFTALGGGLGLFCACGLLAVFAGVTWPYERPEPARFEEWIGYPEYSAPPSRRQPDPVWEPWAYAEPPPPPAPRRIPVRVQPPAVYRVGEPRIVEDVTGELVEPPRQIGAGG